MKLTISNKLYIIGTTIWLLTLARIADFNPLEHMSSLSGQALFF